MSGENFIYLGMEDPIVLSGISYPKLIGFLDSVHQSVKSILTTPTCSRRMRPEYGCAVFRYLFDTNDALLLSKIRIEVRRALTLNEPRINVAKVEVTKDKAEKGGQYENLIVVNVVYEIHGEFFAATIEYPVMG